MHTRFLCFGHVRFSDAERRLIYAGFESRSPGDAARRQSRYDPTEVRHLGPYETINAYGEVTLDREALERDKTRLAYMKESREYLDFLTRKGALMYQEIRTLSEQAAVLRDGPQKRAIHALINKYELLGIEWGDRLEKAGMEIEDTFKRGAATPADVRVVSDIRPQDRPKFANLRYRMAQAQRELPEMLSALQAEARNLKNQFAIETQRLLADAIVEWQTFEGLKNVAGVRAQELRAAGMRAVAAIDRIGSHLFANNAGENVSPVDTEPLVQAVQQQLQASRIVLSDEEVRTSLSIEALLQMKRDLLAALTMKLPEDDLNVRQALVLTTRRERRYLVERGATDPQRIGDLGALEAQQTVELIRLRARMTNANLADPFENPSETLRLAQQELQFLQSFAPDTAEGAMRMRELYNRDPRNLGIIQRSREKMLQSDRAANDALNLDTKDLRVLYAGLGQIQKEGAALYKYMNEVSTDTYETRLSTLVEKQKDVLTRIWALEQEQAGADPKAMSDAVLRVRYQVNHVRGPSANAEFVRAIDAEMRAYVANNLRTEVNTMIVHARQANRQRTGNPVETEAAVQAILAEQRVLSLLGIDADRQKELQKEMNLVQALNDAAYRLLPDSDADKTVGGANFVRALETIDAEQRIRRAAGLDPVQERALEARRNDAMRLLSNTVDWAARGLSEVSPLSEVLRVKSLVDAEWEKRGGSAMVSATRRDELARYGQKIERLIQRDRQKKEEQETARRRKPLDDANAFLDTMKFEIQSFNNGNLRGQTSAQLETFIEQLSHCQKKIEDLRKQYEEEGYSALNVEIEAWEKESIQTRAGLDHCLFLSLSKSTDPRSIAQAARMFIHRYDQWKIQEAMRTENASNLEPSSITREQLLRDLLGGEGPDPAEGSLLKKAQGSIPIRELQEYSGLLDELQRIRAALSE